MQSKEFTISDVVGYIQDKLLFEKYGIFIDGEAIAAILDLEMDFLKSEDIHVMQICDCEETHDE